MPASDKRNEASRADPNSAANIDAFRTEHVSLVWNVDFDKRAISGRVTLRIAREEASASELRLDGLGLDISGMTVGGQSVPFDVRSGPFGQVVVVDVGAGESLFDLVVDYRTTKKCSAVQWLTAEQTVGGKHPYLFTQCQVAQPDSLIDTPAIKATLDAEVTVPAPLNAVMSANRREELAATAGKRVFKFAQTTPIPAYLIALAVGDIHGRDIGPRSTLWSEREWLARGAAEFVDTEAFISTAESLTSPYVWERYDILLLPPSFPYGGMENPCLTFLTPSIVTGDRSLVDVVAHEISHSWTGNLVTNVSWEHFWLNEGFTMFLERKILGRMHGEAFRHLDAIVGLGSLRDAIESFPKDSPATQLVVDLSATDPDDVFSTVPYEKGHTFLAYLEELVGGPAAFEPYLAAYVHRFAGKSISTAEWRDFLLEFFPAGTFDAVDWSAWFYGRGMPPAVPRYDDTLVRPCKDLALAYANKTKSSGNDRAAVFERLSVQQRLVFLDALIDGKASLDRSCIAVIDRDCRLSESRNVEVCLKWFMLCLNLGEDSVLPLVSRYVCEHGRMKYNRPLYRAMAEMSPEGARLAVETFAKNEAFYHPIAAQMIAKDLAKYQQHQK